MAVDTVQPQTTTRREQMLDDLDVSDLSAAGVQAFARSSVDGSVHVERKGGRTYLVVEE